VSINFDDDGCYRSSSGTVVVRKSKNWDKGVEIFSVIASGYIEIDTTSLEMANGIAATLDALTPTGSPYSRERALWALGRLVEARRLLATIVEHEAKNLGHLQDGVRDAAERLYGKRYE